MRNTWIYIFPLLTALMCQTATISKELGDPLVISAGHKAVVSNDESQSVLATLQGNWVVFEHAKPFPSERQKTGESEMSTNYYPFSMTIGAGGIFTVTDQSGSLENAFNFTKYSGRTIRVSGPNHFYVCESSSKCAYFVFREATFADCAYFLPKGFKDLKGLYHISGQTKGINKWFKGSACMSKQDFEQRLKNQNEAEFQKKLSKLNPDKNAPIQIAHIDLSRNSINIPEVTITLRNKSGKTVDGVRMKIFCFNNFDEPVRGLGSNRNEYMAILQEVAAPGENLQGTWTLHGYDNTTKTNVKILDVHFTDGSKWTNKQ